MDIRNLPLPKRPTRRTLASFLKKVPMKNWTNSAYLDEWEGQFYSCAYGIGYLALHPDADDFPTEGFEEVRGTFNLDTVVCHPDTGYEGATVLLGDKMELFNDYGYRAAAFALEHPNATWDDLREAGLMEEYPEDNWGVDPDDREDDEYY